MVLAESNFKNGGPTRGFGWLFYFLMVWKMVQKQLKRCCVAIVRSHPEEAWRAMEDGTLEVTTEIREKSRRTLKRSGHEEIHVFQGYLNFLPVALMLQYPLKNTRSLLGAGIESCRVFPVIFLQSTMVTVVLLSGRI